MELVDAVILAAGRFRRDEAARMGNEIKALIRVGNATPLEMILAAVRHASNVRRIVVVGPSSIRTMVSGVDLWLKERSSGEENALAGLREAGTRRALLCASDLPFVTASHVDDFLSRVPDDADFAYPIYEREEFLAAFPGGRSKFARVGDAYWTGGSLCVVSTELALANEQMLRSCFAARRSQVAMASLLGLPILARHMFGRLSVEHVVQRLSRLTGGKAVAVLGAYPELAMDCDSVLDVDYVQKHGTVLERRA